MDGRTQTKLRKGPAIALLTVALWGVNIGIGALVILLGEQNERMWAAVLARVLISGVGVAFCFGIFAVLMKFKHKPFWWRAVALAVLTPLAGETYAWIDYFGVSFAEGAEISIHPTWPTTLTVMSRWAWFFCAWAGLVMAIDYFFDAKDEEIRARDLLNYANRMKLQALYQQVNPHFLFNCLNSISSLIGDNRNEDADRMIDLLAGYFRRTLSLDPEKDVALEDEVAMQQEYLAIEQLRFPDLAVDIRVPEDLRRAPVPALVLQPLVENAIKHGIASAKEPGRIVIDAARDGGALVLSVENSGAHGNGHAKGTGTGLRNLRDRLETRFGRADAQLSADRTPDGGFAAVMRFPIASTT